MILVTGGTGFIGQVLVKNLVSLGYPVRLLLNPARDYPKLPKGVPVEVAISSIYDERNLRAAMKDVDIVFHLVGTEWRGIYAEYEAVDIPAARMFSEVAHQMRVERFFFLSHIGADKASAYDYLKAKAAEEAAIQQSGVAYTIIRSAVVYGPRDHFTTLIRDCIRKIPGPLLIPGGDATCIQPLWVEDLVTCMLLCMDDQKTRNQILYTGGIDALSFSDCVELVMEEIGKRKRVVPLNAAWLRSIYIAYEQWFPRLPHMYFWLDYLAEDRLTALDTLPREFGLMPTRLTRNIAYLKEKDS